VSGALKIVDLVLKNLSGSFDLMLGSFTKMSGPLKKLCKSFDILFCLKKYSKGYKNTIFRCLFLDEVQREELFREIKYLAVEKEVFLIP